MESLIPLLFFLLFFIFCGYIIKRRWVDKKSIPGGIQFTSEHVYTQFQNKNRKQAIEHVHYLNEDDEVEDEEGDDVSRFSKKNS